MTPRVEIVIDRDCCVGSTICLSLAPAVFELAADGQASVRDPAGDSLTAIVEAAEGCPTMAITVRDAESGRTVFPAP